MLNVLGNVVYGLFNFGLLWLPSVQVLSAITTYKYLLLKKLYLQLQYYQIHPMGIIPVQINDAVFSLHAIALSIVTAIQCAIYEVKLLFS